MTQPPDGPGRHEPTRRLDPRDGADEYDNSPTQAYSDPEQPYEPTAATQYHQPTDHSGYYDGPYTQAQYAQGQPPAQGQPAYNPGPPAQPPKKNAGRTIGLSLAIILALIVIGFVGYRIVDRNGSSDTTAATSSETTAEESTATESSTTESTTEETTSTPATGTDPVPVGQVTYQITGDGDVVGLRYTTSTGSQFLAAVGSPWQQTTKVANGTAAMSAIVVRGKLTCTISRGDNVLSSSTSAGGTLNCSATLPAAG